MRVTLFLAACLSLVAVAWGNNLIMGRRQPGETLVTDEVIIRPRIIGKPQLALCNATAPDGFEISFVSVVSRNPWIVNIRPVAGGLGTDSIVVAAVGKPSWGFGIRCTVLAVPKKTTTAATSTTPKTTTAKSTTPTPSTSTSTTSTTTSTPSTTTSTPSTTTSTPSTSTSTTSTSTSTPSTTTSTPSTSTSTPSTSTSTPSTTPETTTEEPCTSTPEPTSTSVEE